MNQKEREEEAARRATERVFQEDNVLINGINYVRGRRRAVDLVVATLMPFLKTPTNVAIRAMQYSPMGPCVYGGEKRVDRREDEQRAGL